MPADRLPLAFRIGVTGTRAIDPEARPRVLEGVRKLFATVRACSSAVAAEPWARAVHGPDEPRLSLLSPLAVGSDRLAAEVALEQGYVLGAVLPFPADDYARDFPESVEAFQDLLGRAGPRVLTLDGARGEAEWRSYGAAGRVVVRNCDLLVAIWDDTVLPKGCGGTEDTLRFALRSAVPVWWVHAGGLQPPRLLTEALDLHGTESHRLQPDAAGGLQRIVEERLRQPMLSEREQPARSVIEALMTNAPGQAEIRPPLVWRGHQALMSVLTAHLPALAPGPAVTQDYWGRAYARSDAQALAFAARYRSSYVYVIGLAASALSFAAGALAEEALDAPRLLLMITAVGELAALVVLLAVVLRARGARWHALWLRARLLAELFRKQQALATLGWSLPRQAAALATRTGPSDGSWVEWCFDAALRAAPLVTGSLSGPRLHEVCETIRGTLWAGQTAYHRRRAALSERAANILLRFGSLCFGGTLVLVGLKVGLLAAGVESPLVVWLGLAATVLPAVSAAAFTMRSYAEFEVLNAQSERMIFWLDALDARLTAFDARRPLASQDLGASLYELTTAMLSDVAGWAQLFRAKAVEAG